MRNAVPPIWFLRDCAADVVITEERCECGELHPPIAEFFVGIPYCRMEGVRYQSPQNRFPLDGCMAFTHQIRKRPLPPSEFGRAGTVVPLECYGKGTTTCSSYLQAYVAPHIRPEPALLCKNDTHPMPCPCSRTGERRTSNYERPFLWMKLAEC
jgi:hypothetical protein